MSAFSGAVLTGGRSRRMGTDKALLGVGGRPLVTRGGDALRSAGAAEVLAVGGDQAALSRLGFRTVPDLRPGQGPLGGLVTALDAARHDPVVVLACDLPRIAAAAVTALLDAIEAGDAPGANGGLPGGPDAVVALAGGRRQVLLGAYRRRCLPTLRAAFERGVRSVHQALEELDVSDVPLDDDRWADDVDDPAALAAGEPWPRPGSPS